jgi:hypothetical protein
MVARPQEPDRRRIFAPLRSSAISNASIAGDVRGVLLLFALCLRQRASLQDSGLDPAGTVLQLCATTFPGAGKRVGVGEHASIWASAGHRFVRSCEGADACLLLGLRWSGDHVARTDASPRPFARGSPSNRLQLRAPFEIELSRGRVLGVSPGRTSPPPSTSPARWPRSAGRP